MSGVIESTKSWFQGIKKARPNGLLDLLLFRFTSNYFLTLMPVNPILTKEDKDLVNDEITRVIHEQISFLPYYLKIPVFLISLFFETQTLLTKGKRFSSLTEDVRIVLIQNWSSSSINFKRDFIKFFRTLTLFAFYDHPMVHEKFGLTLEHRRAAIIKKGT